MGFFFFARSLLLFNLNLQLRNHITLNRSSNGSTHFFRILFARIRFFFSRLCYHSVWPLITKLDSVNCRNVFLATVFRTDAVRKWWCNWYTFILLGCKNNQHCDRHQVYWGFIVNYIWDSLMMSVVGIRVILPFFPNRFLFAALYRANRSFHLTFQQNDERRKNVDATFSMGSSMALKLFFKSKLR